jgi:glycosyltransferase involved in cell wall biosynthesis
MPDKKRVLIFSLAYHPFVGGAEVAVKEITERLGDGFEFEMITANLDGRQPELEKNFYGLSKVYRLGRRKIDKYLFPWLARKKAEELHRQNNYDLIWAVMANQAGWAALKFKNKFPQIPYLLTLQEGDSEWDIWLRTFLIRPVYKAIYRRADFIQAISNFLAQRAKNLGAQCPIEVVPNGIKTQSSKLKVQNNNSDFNIITVSRLVKKNGIEDLIRAVKILVQDYGLSIVLDIVGDGYLNKKLKKLVANLKIEEQINFLGSVSNEEVYGHLSRADIFVRPSLSEGLGNAFLEAMSMGVPVIGTRVGGIPDFLIDGETGWFCEAKNPKNIAEKISYVLDEKNKEEVARVAANARKMVAEKYNWEKISQAMAGVFRRCLLAAELRSRKFKFGKLLSQHIYYSLFPIEKTETVLNVGCGDGSQAIIYHGRFNKMVGIDINPDRLALANLAMAYYDIKNFETICANVERLLLSESFDKALAIDLIEHVVEPDKVLSEIKRLLKPAGELMITFPAMHDKWENLFRFVGRKILRRRGKTVYKVGWDPDRHQYDYSISQWLELMDKNGFKLLRSRASTMFPPLHYLGVPRFWFTNKLIRVFDGFFCQLPVLKNYGQTLLCVFKIR